MGFTIRRKLGGPSHHIAQPITLRITRGRQRMLLPKKKAAR